jgi:hypothetical protein
LNTAGAADLLNTSSGAAPTWTFASTQAATSGCALALTENTSGGSTFKTQVGAFVVGP